MKRRSFIGAAAAAAASATAPAAAQVIHPIQPVLPPQQFAQQLNVAVNVTLSGDLQKLGSEVVKGVQAAIDEQNRYNAPLVTAWGVRPLDDRNDATLAMTNASVAASDPSVVAVIGNLTAPMTLASLSRYANVGLALVVPTVTADAVTKRGYHNVYRLPAKDSTAGALFAGSVLAGKRGVSSIAVALDGDYGYDVARGFADRAKSDRHPADVLLFPQNKTDPAQAARTVLDRSPGFVFLAGKSRDLGPIAEALRLGGYQGEFGCSDGFYDTQTIETYAKTLDGAYVASPMPPIDRIPSAVQLLTDFQREVGQITPFSAYGYAAAQLVIAASQRGNAKTRYDLLRSLQQGGTFTTLVGQFSFNVFGDPIVPDIYLYTVTKDGFKYAHPAIRTGFVV